LIADRPPGDSALSLTGTWDECGTPERVRVVGQGSAVLVLLPGKFTPIFRADEMDSLRQFGVAATAALERLHLISQMTRRQRGQERVPVAHES
jgi:hypothetical protein